MTTEEKIELFIEKLRDQKGVSWQHQARLPGVAVDCAGLVIVAAEQAGFNLIDNTNYERVPDSRFLLTVIQKNGLLLVPKDKFRKGDLLVLKFGGNPQHLAVVTETFEDSPPRIIHAAANVKKVVEHLLSKDWQAKLSYVYRLKELV